MSLTYAQYKTSLANLLVVEESNTDYTTDLPNVIDDAELRLYRVLDLLDTSVRDSSAIAISHCHRRSAPWWW
jgi:hypothetical protein